MKAPELNLQTALAGLPHGPEFRFIDRLICLEPGQSAIGEFTVPPDAPFLRGHFPDQPLMPGVLLLEAAAQLAGIVAQSDPVIPQAKRLRLTAVRAAKILGTAQPGETVRFESRVLHRLNGLIQAEGRALLRDRLILQTELTLSAET